MVVATIAINRTIIEGGDTTVYGWGQLSGTTQKLSCLWINCITNSVSFYSFQNFL